MIRRPFSSRHRLQTSGYVVFSERVGVIPESNRVIQSVWLGAPLSTLEMLCMKSFLKNGHEFHLYTYDDLKGIPSGVVVKDANEIVPYERIKEFRWSAGFSDFFRYSMLLNGGWYVDMDVICLRPLDFSSEYVFAASSCMDFENNYTPLDLPNRYMYKTKHFVGDAFLKAPANSELMRYCQQLVEGDDRKGAADFPYDEFGPRLFKKAVRKFGLEKYIRVPIVFDPVPHRIAFRVVDPTASWDLRDSYVAHLNRSVWNKGATSGPVNLMTEDSYPDDCLYETLKKRCGL